MIDARKVAVLGIGFGPLAAAALGLVVTTTEPNVVTPEPVVYNSGTGGVGSDGAGTGYIKKDYGWVRLTKVARSGTAAYDATPAVRSLTGLECARANAAAQNATASASLSQAIDTQNAIGRSYNPAVSLAAGVEVGRGVASVGANPCRVEWLGIDEIMVIVDEMNRN